MEKANHALHSEKAADNIRLLSAAMVEKANSGHPGGPMGGADFVQVLYSEFLRFDPDEMSWPFRDRFYLDAGHMSAMLYSVQTLLGNYSLEDIRNFRQWGSPTPGHPELDIERGIENTSGPLGLGHAFGIGSAIAERFLAARFGETIAHKTYVYISDGGIQEEISQGAGRIAGHLGLGNIIMFYDANDIQLSTEVDVVTTEDTAKKYEAWGWHVLTIPGNDHNAIRKALTEGIAETAKPTLIIGKTLMGKGAKKEDGSSFEGEVELHGQPLGKSNASFTETIKGLGGDPENTFQIFPEVSAYYQNVREQKREEASQRKANIKEWETAYPEKAKKLSGFLRRELPEIDWAAIEQKADVATRNSSAAVLGHLAEKVENMIVSSADLANSDKTEAFLKKTGEFKKGDFSGAFLQAGVAELTMAAFTTGMALHGGVIPACATFFAFSDYMKPAIRVCALMETPAIFLWTHDAFRVGEDGPTHQPIEQEAQLRLLEKLKNHSGHNSLLALRPADAHETTWCWKMALENTHSPSGLIFSRQNVTTIAVDGIDRKEQARQAEKGAYIVYKSEQPRVVLIANGSEVSTLMGAVPLLEEKGIGVQVVSVPSEGVFRNQAEDYQQELLPDNLPRYGLTAGLPVTLEGLTGAKGKVHGVNHFGYSAPFKVLDEKFGFTPEHVAKEVMEFIK
jgi:transketolase